MRIGIDARFWGEAGPGRYVQNLIGELEKIDKKNEYFIFLRRKAFTAYQPQNPSFKKVLAPYRWYTIGEQIFMPLLIWRAGVDLVHFAQFNMPIFWPGKFVVTIHDMIMHEFSTERATTRSKLVHRIKRMLFLFVFWWAVKRARHILVPSLATKDDLIKKLKVEPAKITVTYEGVDKKFKNQNAKCKIEKVLEKYGIRKPYLLYVGSMYPHKNLEKLVEAFAILKGRYGFGGQLVLVGKESYFSHKLQSLVHQRNLSGEIIFPGARVESGYIPDEEVRALYSQGLLYIFPSLKEGFGIPPLEAMSMGLPVTASNLSSIPEICGKAALYFDPRDPEDIARKVDGLVKDETKRKALVEEGHRQVRKFSWERLARQTLEVYEIAG